MGLPAGDAVTVTISREQIDTLVIELATALKRRLPEQIRFFLVLADEGEHGSMGYGSSMTRESAVSCLGELLPLLRATLKAGVT